MKISVIIPTFNAGKTIHRCLAALEKQTYKNFETIVVDGSSTDKTVEVIEKGDFNLRLKKWKSSGPGEKRNVGAKMVKGEILFFLDSDLALCKNALSELVKIFKKIGPDGVTGLPLTPKDSGTLDYVVGLDYEHRFENMGEGFVDVAATTMFAVKKKAFFRTGCFDLRFRRATGEDWDFSAKMRKKGFTIYHTHKVRGYHYTAEKLSKYLKKQYHHAKYRIEHIKEHRKLVDKYTKPYIFLQSMWWAFLPLVIFFPSVFILILLITNLWTMPETFKLYSRAKDKRVFLLMPLSSIRSFYWGVGTAIGVLELLFRGGKH